MSRLFLTAAELETLERNARLARAAYIASVIRAGVSLAARWVERLCLQIHRPLFRLHR